VVLFLLKLILIPTLIGLISLAGRLWGAGISGWLASLPIVAGPIVLFMALEQGVSFAAQAAHNTLVGLISLSAFCFVYSWLAQRRRWLPSLLAGWLAFFSLTFIFSRLPLSLPFSFVGVILLLLAVLKWFPRPPVSRPPALPRFELPLRMVAAAFLVTLLTALAGALGPRLSGLLAPFPIIATVLAIFTHHFQGGPAAVQLIRGLVSGFFTFAIFFLVLTLALEPYGLGPAFTLASAIALVIHGCAFPYVKKYLSQSQLAPHQV
jgi:hypothetical protein